MRKAKRPDCGDHDWFRQVGTCAGQRPGWRGGLAILRHSSFLVMKSNAGQHACWAEPGSEPQEQLASSIREGRVTVWS